MKNLDWEKLSFGYMPTDYNVRCYYRSDEGLIKDVAEDHAQHNGHNDLCQ